MVCGGGWRVMSGERGRGMRGGRGGQEDLEDDGHFLLPFPLLNNLIRDNLVLNSER